MKKTAKSLWLLFAQAFTVAAAAALAAAALWPRGEAPESYRGAVARALPSVVSVYRREDSGRTGISENDEGGGNSERGENGTGGIRDGVRTDGIRDGVRTDGIRVGGNGAGGNIAGAGVIVGDDGRILTSYHLVATAEVVEVGLPDGGRHVADVLWVDPEIDIAALQIHSARSLSALPLADDSALRPGDVVFAIGNPFGLRRTATMGIVSDTGRSGLGLHQVERFIQTDAAFNPGSSGGPLVNVRGELVGINSAVFSRRRAGVASGIGFAVPAGLAWQAQERMLGDGDEDGGDNGDGGGDGDGKKDFGVRLRKLPPRLREEIYGSRVPPDASVVGYVRPGSDAAALGLRPGDVLLESEAALSSSRRAKVLRGGKRVTLTAE